MLSGHSLLILLLFGPPGVFPEPANTRKGPGCSPTVRAGYENQWPQGLDYGIYWIGPAGAYEKASGLESAHYNPKRPTAVFFHGWQGAYGGTTRTCFRMGTRCKSCKEHVEIMDAWFAKGWNIGMFYWDQFADEKCVRDAEFKIWQGDEQPLRWLSNDAQDPYKGHEEYHDYVGSATNVAELCAESFQQALYLYEGPEVRFIGESLGTQLAARCLELVRASTASTGFHLAPQRLVLLEPAFSHAGLIGLLQCERVANSLSFGAVAEERTNAVLKKLMAEGIPVELYTTSPFVWTAIVCANPHVYHDVHVHFQPRWCRFPLTRYIEMDFQNNVACFHDSVVSLYYLSMGSPPMRPDYAGANTSVSVNCPVPTAATTLSEILSIRAKCISKDVSPHYIQTRGLSTLNESDDAFSIKFEIPKMKADPSVVNVTLVESLMRKAHPAAMARMKDTAPPKPESTWMYMAAGVAVTCCVCGCGFIMLSGVCRNKRKYGRRALSVSPLHSEGDGEEESLTFVTTDDEDN